MRKVVLNIELVTQNKSRAGYRWKFEDIYFFNLNVNPSGGGKDSSNQNLQCKAATNLVQNNDPAIDDNKCREYIVKETGVRLVHPLFALKFLDDNLVRDSQIVVMTHYGPFNQDRISNDELENFCTIVKKHRARIIAWIVGHTHKTDYYEWECGNYKVPVFNVGNYYDSSNANSQQMHFGFFRIGKNWLEAIDISYDRKVTPKKYFAPGIQKRNTKRCKSAIGGNPNWDGTGRGTPFNMTTKHGDFDSFSNSSYPDVAWCNPDCLWAAGK